jgi:hypothetical protein
MLANKKILVFACVVLALGFIAGSVSQRQSLPAPQAVKSVLASIMVDYGNGAIKIYSDLAPTPNEPLTELLARTLKRENVEFTLKEYAGLGTLVTKIGNKENGMDQKYWQYWVNNKSPDVGASAYPVQAGDIIEWKFIAYNEE